MGDQQGDAVVRREVAAELDPQRHRDRHVEAGERLVEQQQPGLGGQRPGDRHPLGLAAGELARACGRRGRRRRAVEPVRARPRPPRRRHARGPAARRPRCRGRRGAGTAAGPGRPARPALAGAARRAGRCRRGPHVPSAGDQPGQRAAAARSCRRRWARSPRPPRRARRLNAASTRPGDPQVAASRPSRGRSWRAQPAVAQREQDADRDDAASPG